MQSDRSKLSLIGIGICVGLTGSAILASASGLPRVFSAGIALALLVLVLVLSLYPFELWSRGRRREALPECAVVVACGLLLVGIVTSNWPMQLSHRLARAQLEDIARQAREGVKFKTPLRVGLFTIEDVEVRHRGRWAVDGAAAEAGATDLKSIVCLWLSRRHETLIAQCGLSRPMFNVFTMSALDERWVFVTED